MAAGEALGDKRNVNVILRLVLNAEGGLEQGEALDIGGRVAGRFDQWEVMILLIQHMVGEEPESVD